EKAGVTISGLHWLLVGPEGLSITSLDSDIRLTTASYVKGLINLCADLGGSYLVHGSPAQRRLPDDPKESEQARAHALELFHEVAEVAESASVTYCIEALSVPESNFINSIEEAVEIVDQVSSPNLRTMLDCRAALTSEQQTPEQLINLWMPRGYLAHIHFNDTNRRGPGQGETDFHPIISALRENNYSGWIGMEPFIYQPDGPSTAAFIAGYLKGLFRNNQ
ncbi:MAG: sugar phosphate isomerase/epimerase family protein, partial [Desulfobulbia bacterium]